MKRGAVVLGILLFASSARADDGTESRPQANVGVNAGVVGVGQGHFWDKTQIFLGARGDVLFGRSGNHDWGFGPMAGLGTYWFHDWSAQAGASLLIPVHEYLPFVLSVGPYVRRDGEWDPGVFASLFWGDRSFNYHSDYVLAGGLIAEMRYGVGDARERSVIIAAHIDGEIFVLPALLLLNAFR